MNRETLQLKAQITASDTNELYEIANSRGIQMPHPALAIFKSVLCEVEKSNANGIRLGKKATDAAVSTLIGTQINKNHLRSGNVMGHIIDAKINKDKEIEIACIFFKDIYEEEWEEAKELFKDNKLTMSFELSADIESQDKLADGTKRLNDYYFTGAGLLFGVKPACKKARVFEMATKKLFNQLSMERQSLIFANNQNSQKSIMEVLKLMADEVKKIEEVKVEETVVAETAKAEEPVKVEEAKVEAPVVSEAPVEAKTDEVVAEPVKVEEPVVETPVVEAKTEEVIAQPEVETKVEDLVITTETTQVVIDTLSQNSETIKVETEVTKSVNDEVKEHSVTTQEVTYTYAQVEEIKAKYEQEIANLKEQVAAKDKEVESLKAAKEVKVEAAIEEPVVLATGHKKIDASTEDSSSPIAKILKNKRSYRK